MHELAFEIAKNDVLLKLAIQSFKTGIARPSSNGRGMHRSSLGYFKLFENAWFQMRKGTLERDHWEGYDAFLRSVWVHPTVNAVVVDEADVLRARLSTNTSRNCEERPASHTRRACADGKSMTPKHLTKAMQRTATVLTHGLERITNILLTRAVADLVSR